MKNLSIGSGGLYVESGVTGNIVYCGRGGEENTVPAIWQKAYPNLLIPKIHMWVIFNNRFHPLPGVTPPNWPAVIQRSLETSTRAATATAERHLFAIAEISRLKRKPRHRSVWTLFGSAHEGQLANEWKGRVRSLPLLSAVRIRDRLDRWSSGKSRVMAVSVTLGVATNKIAPDDLGQMDHLRTQ